MAYWLFQANAEYFDIVKALEEQDLIAWIVTRYRKEMEVGDRVAVWKSGSLPREAPGLYALGHIESFAIAGRDRFNYKYWIYKSDYSFVGKEHAQVRIDKKMLNDPIPRSAFLTDPILKETSLIRMRIGTNFRLTEEQWKRIQELVKSKRSSVPAQ